MINLEQSQYLEPQSKQVTQDLHRQLLALRNYKALELINQSNEKYDVPWLSDTLKSLTNLDTRGRDIILNHPAVYLWIENAKTVLEKHSEKQGEWRFKGFIYLCINIWLKFNMVPEFPPFSCLINNELVNNLNLYNKNKLNIDFSGLSAVNISIKEDTLFITNDTFYKSWKSRELANTLDCYPFLCNQTLWTSSYLDIITPSELRMDKMELVEEISEDISILFTEALELVETCWPEMHTEIKENVKHIIFFKPPGLPFFSDFRVHGVIFASHLKRPLINVAEWLIHEASHIRLNTLMCARPHLIDDMKAIYPSPWRDELRPLYGIYHGCFVHSRLLRFYRFLIKDTSPFKTIALKEIDRITGELEKGLLIITENANLTSEGMSLVKEMKQNLTS